MNRPKSSEEKQIGGEFTGLDAVSDYFNNVLTLEMKGEDPNVGGVRRETVMEDRGVVLAEL